MQQKISFVVNCNIFSTHSFMGSWTGRLLPLRETKHNLSQIKSISIDEAKLLH